MFSVDKKMTRVSAAAKAVILAIAFCNVTMVIAYKSTPNSLAMENEIEGQIQLLPPNNERRLHWTGVPDNIENADLCTRAHDGNTHTAADQLTVLEKATYVYKRNSEPYGVTALLCTRVANQEKTWIVRADISTCVYMFEKSGHTSYVPTSKVCELPAL